MSDRVTMLIITDGREHGEYLRRTFASFQERLHGVVSDYLMIDDSGSSKDEPAQSVHSYGKLLDDAYGKMRAMTIVHHPTRLGFGETIRDAWTRIPKDSDFVLHVEDDFLLNRTLNLYAWMSVLKNNPRVAQIAAVRQPWSQAEKEVGGYFNLRPDAYRDTIYYGTNGNPYDVVVSSNFSTNPCLYPRWLCALGWPEGENSEGQFTFKLNPHGLECLLWGKRTDPPLVEHFGVRQGTGY